jgi:hypothetical protein
LHWHLPPLLVVSRKRLLREDAAGRALDAGAADSADLPSNRLKFQRMES